MADTKLRLRLLIDRSRQKILYAEAEKEFVDFLFYLLALPIGTVNRLITSKSMGGSLGNLYDSVENMSEAYFLRNQDKDSLVRPQLPASIQLPLLLKNEHRAAATPTSSSKKFYICSGCHRNIADDPSVFCPTCPLPTSPFGCGSPFGTSSSSAQIFGSCPSSHTSSPSFSTSASGASVRRNINTKVNYIAAGGLTACSSGEGGFVKGVVTYMVTDDLVVSPMSTISTITLLNKFNVKDVGALEEKVVDVTMVEGLKLLEVSLQSKSVLTSVFLGHTGA